MAITKANIITEVDENLQTGFVNDPDTIDRFIQKVLDDLSEEDLLVDTDATQTLVSGDKTLAYPTGYRAMIALTLTVTSGSSEQHPLEPLPGGQQQYRSLRHNDDSTGIPRWFSDFNSQFFLWRPANQAFSSLIEFYKDHPQDVENIEFSDNYKNAIFAGVTFYAGLKFNRPTAINTWGPMYESAKQKRIDAMPRQPRISRG